MAPREWTDGRVGVVEGGRYAGMYATVESDASGTGFHIWLTQRHPATGPSDGWDIWADVVEDVDAGFNDELAPVRWL